MLAQKKMPDGQKEEISQVRISVKSNKLDNFFTRRLTKER